MGGVINDLGERGVRFIARVNGELKEFPPMEEASVLGVPLFRTELRVPQGKLLLTVQPRKDGRWFAGSGV